MSLMPSAAQSSTLVMKAADGPEIWYTFGQYLARHEAATSVRLRNSPPAARDVATSGFRDAALNSFTHPPSVNISLITSLVLIAVPAAAPGRRPYTIARVVAA